MRRYLLFVLLMSNILWGQQWYKGEATAIGGETESIGSLRQRALQAARVKALQQAGITIQAVEMRIQGEAKLTSVDLYGSFAQSDARGIIIDERNLSFRSQFVAVGDLSLPQITASIEALVEVPTGEPDRTFDVSLAADKKTYYEKEDLQLSAESSKDGYLSIFQIKNDTCFVLHPHPLVASTFNNKIAAHTKILVPPAEKPYSFELNLEGGNGEHAMEFFVAVVTKEEIPIGGRLNKQESFSLKEFNNWLVNIPVDQRSSASIVIQIVKK